MEWYNTRPNRLSGIFILVLGVTGLFFALLQSMGIETGFHPFCLFKTLTGIPCPACGSSRAAVLLLHGDFIGALKMNPMVYLAFLFFAYTILLVLTDFIKGSELFQKFMNALNQVFKKHAWLVYVFILLVGINWIWNISKFT